MRVKVIEKYLQSTHANTHSDYTMSVLDIFKLDREGESDGFLQLHNRYLKSATHPSLWSNVAFDCCFFFSASLLLPVLVVVVVVVLVLVLLVMLSYV